MEASPPQTVAGVDLGSNSFHMIVARVDESGHINIQDKLRDRVRLAAGLNDDHSLTDEAKLRALASLGRMGERVRGLPRAAVRAVGTNTLRQARDPEFLDRAQKALGHPIDIISGREEARLIYLGVAHSLSEQGERRLVVDIGGGSTECIIGERFEPVEADSLYMGCVSYTMRFFPDGRLTKDRFQRAEIAAALELETIIARFRHLGWHSAVGSSGTAIAARKMIEANHWSERNITLKGLKKLRKALLAHGRIEGLNIPGLEADRAPVIAGGIAILKAVFDNLGIEEMQTAKGALREGLIYDLIGRIRHEDVRDKTIRAIAEHYKVDKAQVERVRRTVVDFFDQAAGPLSLRNTDGRPFIQWAAWVYEIGLSISYTGYHKHSAYLLENLDMPGFSRTGRAALAAIVLGHRRKLSEDLVKRVRPQHQQEVLRLALLFRLAVRLNRSRSQEPLPRTELIAEPGAIRLVFPDSWLDDHPLTRADLEEEVSAFRDVGFELSFE